jgi:hypothetical protein
MYQVMRSTVACSRVTAAPLPPTTRRSRVSTGLTAIQVDNIIHGRVHAQQGAGLNNPSSRDNASVIPIRSAETQGASAVVAPTWLRELESYNNQSIESYATILGRM